MVTSVHHEPEGISWQPFYSDANVTWLDNNYYPEIKMSRVLWDRPMAPHQLEDRWYKPDMYRASMSMSMRMSMRMRMSMIWSMSMRFPAYLGYMMNP